MSTVKRQIEEIKQLFPDVAQTQIIYDLDIAQKNFCRETRILDSVLVTLTDIHTAIVFALPAGFNALKRINYYDASGNPLYEDDLMIGADIEGLNIYFHSTGTEPIKTIPAQIAQIDLIYMGKPTAITTLTSTWSVDDEYITGVTAYLYSEYFAKYPQDIATSQGIAKVRDFKAVQYWEAKKAEYRKNAKLYVNSKDIRPLEPVNYPAGGQYDLPKHVNQDV